MRMLLLCSPRICRWGRAPLLDYKQSGPIWPGVPRAACRGGYNGDQASCERCPIHDGARRLPDMSRSQKRSAYMSRIGFGWFLPNGPESPEARATFAADVDRNLQAVTGHFTSAWMADHLQAEMHDMLEGWTTLTYYAARHPELQFGHAVLCQSYRNPALLAKTAATFQYLTGGRLVFGLG